MHAHIRGNPYSYGKNYPPVSDQELHTFAVNYVPVDRHGYISMANLHLGAHGAGTYRGVQQKIYRFRNDVEGFPLHIDRELNAGSLADAKKKIRWMYPDAKFVSGRNFLNY